MNSAEVRKRFVEGVAGEADARFVEDALMQSDAIALEDVVVPYMKNYPQINEAALLGFCEMSSDSYLISEILKGLSYAGHKSDRYLDLLYRYASGVDWDFNSELAISAVSCFPRAAPLSARTIEILKECYFRGNPVLSDVTIEAIQTYLGVPNESFVRGDGTGDLAARVTSGVREWLLDRGFIPAGAGTV